MICCLFRKPLDSTMAYVLSTREMDSSGAFRRLRKQRLPLTFTTNRFNGMLFIDCKRIDENQGYFRFCAPFLPAVLRLAVKRLLFGWQHPDNRSLLLQAEELMYFAMKEENSVTTIAPQDVSSKYFCKANCMVDERTYMGEKYLYFRKHNKPYHLAIRFDEAGVFLLNLIEIYIRELGPRDILYSSILDGLAQYETGRNPANVYAEARVNLKPELDKFKQETNFTGRFGVFDRARQVEFPQGVTIFKQCNCIPSRDGTSVIDSHGLCWTSRYKDYDDYLIKSGKKAADADRIVNMLKDGGNKQEEEEQDDDQLGPDPMEIEFIDE